MLCGGKKPDDDVWEAYPISSDDESLIDEAEFLAEFGPNALDDPIDLTALAEPTPPLNQFMDPVQPSISALLPLEPSASAALLPVEGCASSQPTRYASAGTVRGKISTVLSPLKKLRVKRLSKKYDGPPPDPADPDEPPELPRTNKSRLDNITRGYLYGVHMMNQDYDCGLSYKQLAQMVRKKDGEPPTRQSVWELLQHTSQRLEEGTGGIARPKAKGRPAKYSMAQKLEVPFQTKN